MSNINKNVASCLCGSVNIEVQEMSYQFSVCHCQTCRTWGGGPFFAVQCGTEVKIEGSENISEYESSTWANRGFCKQCGTHLYYQLKKTNTYNIPVGLFPNRDDWVMNMQYFSDQRPGYYCFSEQTEELTSTEIKAYFASQI